jgi:hypothetical protein
MPASVIRLLATIRDILFPVSHQYGKLTAGCAELQHGFVVLVRYTGTCSSSRKVSGLTPVVQICVDGLWRCPV